MKSFKKITPLFLMAFAATLALPSKSAFADKVPPTGTVNFDQVYTVNQDGNVAFDLNVPSSGVVTVNVDDKGSRTWFSDGPTLYIYDKADNTYLEAPIGSKSSKIVSASLCSGDYILYFMTSSNNDAHDINNQFKVTFKAAKETYKNSLLEKYDSILGAKSLKNSVNGFFAVKDNKDCYKYKLSADKVVKFKFTSPDVKTSYMKITNAKGDVVAEFNKMPNGTTYNSVVLKKGVYYVEVYSQDDTEEYSGSYTLKTSTSNLPSNKLKSVKNNSNNRYYSTKSIDVKWSKAKMATGYQIQYSKNNKLTKAKTVKVNGGDTLTATVSSVSANTTYYVRVRAVYKCGSTEAYSKWSNVKSIKVKK